MRKRTTNFWIMVILLQVIKSWRYICILPSSSRSTLSSVERRTINDQEATDLILVHGVFIMFFLLLLIYNYSQLCHLNAKMQLNNKTTQSHFLLMNLEMQKGLINHAFLESGDQLLSKSKSCLENTFQFEKFTF